MSDTTATSPGALFDRLKALKAFQMRNMYRHARIAQYIMMRLEQAVELGYSGVYQGENTA